MPIFWPFCDVRATTSHGLLPDHVRCLPDRSSTLIQKDILVTALMVIGAMTLIVVGDVAGRMLIAAGFTPFFVAWARFALGALILAPFCGFRREEFRALLRPSLILRACLVAAGVSCILTALRTEPLANVFGGFFVGPIIAYFLSALLLREEINLARTLMLLVSFAGVLLVVKPGFGMTAGMAFALLAGTFHGCYLVATRWLARDYRPRFLLFSQLLIGALLLAGPAIGPLPPFDLGLGLLITISALGSAIGNLLLVLANRRAEATVIAPLIYSQIITATILGLLMFGEWPDRIALIGLVIIMLAGGGSVWAAGRAKRPLAET